MLLNFPGVGRKRTASPDGGTSCSCSGTLGFVVVAVGLSICGDSAAAVVAAVVGKSVALAEP